MSNILKIVDPTDRATRRAVFAVFDAAEHRANRKGSERFVVADARARQAPRLRVHRRPAMSELRMLSPAAVAALVAPITRSNSTALLLSLLGRTQRSAP
jgi:hypothetical protein